MVGSRTRAKIVKNKVAAPFREAEFDIIYGEGISREGDLIDLGVDKGVLEKSGTWISYGADRLGQGRENARVFLKENKDIRKKLELATPNNSDGTSSTPAASATPTNGQSDKATAAAAGASGGSSAVNAAKPRQLPSR